MKTEDLSRTKKGKRVYLNDIQTRNMSKRLNEFFESIIEVPRIRVGERQTIETLINEEALLFAKYIRNEQKTWAPRNAIILVSSKKYSKIAKPMIKLK